MNLRTRTIISLLSICSAAAVAAVSLLRLTAPAFAAWYGELSPAILDHIVDGFTASLIGLTVGIAGVVVSLLLFPGGRPREGDHAGAFGLVGLVAVVITIGALLLAPGDLIPVAGYTFAMVAMAIVVTGAVLLTIRRPLAGIVVLAVFAGIIVYFSVRVGDETMLPRLFASLGAELPQLSVTASYLVLATGIVLSAIDDGRTARGAVGRWVLVHRVALTVVAAACSLPYVFVRATWLTPWPLLGPDAQTLAEDPGTLAIGLSLGFAMLAGGVLTIGLVMPWGERFPRWFAGLGGRAVPVGLPVIAAMSVAVLFTTGGVSMVVQAVEGQFGALGSTAVFEIVGLFPFWLWGPMLGLAAWGYAMNRAAQRATADSARDAHAFKADASDANAPAPGLIELDAWESREA